MKEFFELHELRYLGKTREELENIIVDGTYKIVTEGVITITDRLGYISYLLEVTPVLENMIKNN